MLNYEYYLVLNKYIPQDIFLYKYYIISSLTFPHDLEVCFVNRNECFTLFAAYSYICLYGFQSIAVLSLKRRPEQNERGALGKCSTLSLSCKACKYTHTCTDNV